MHVKYPLLPGDNPIAVNNNNNNYYYYYYYIIPSRKTPISDYGDG